MELSEIRVGDQFPMKGSEGVCGSSFEYVEGAGFWLSLFLPGLSRREQVIIERSEITFSFVKETDYFILPMIKFANQFGDMVFELNFDPTVYGIKHEFHRSNMLTIFGIDSNPYIIKTMRMVSIPLTLFSNMVRCWDEADKLPDFSSRYARWTGSLDEQYNIYQLWDYSTVVGRAGEW